MNIIEAFKIAIKEDRGIKLIKKGDNTGYYTIAKEKDKIILKFYDYKTKMEFYVINVTDKLLFKDKFSIIN